MSIFGKLFHRTHYRDAAELKPLVEEINGFESAVNALSDDALRRKTEEFRARIKKNETLDMLLPEAFAVAREAARRTLGQRHYDEQLMGGIMLHQGTIAEMRTGEGKTLVATLSVYLNALSGRGVHVVTVNDYLSRRDTVWMGQVYHALGMTVACVNHDQSYMYDPMHTEKKNGRENANDQNLNTENLDRVRDTFGSFKIVYEYLRPCGRREAYRADITYGTNNEFGFDYLRDNLAYDAQQLIQRAEHEGGLHFAIIDEADSILIDEARTPLIISAPDTTAGDLYKTFSQIARRLKRDVDYAVDEKMKAVSITEEGIDKVENALGIGDIYTEKGITYVHHLEQSLRAEALFARDRDYVINNGEIVIVDEFTGRLMPGRRWSEGLHQAVEAKEGVAIQQESRTMATITFQNLFRMYKKLSGMTGTALTSAEEFGKVYNLEVAVVPTHKPMIRHDLPDRIYQNEKGKFQAVAAEIKTRSAMGQPVLVGTISIEKNEYLSALLQKEGIQHEMLNAKNHEKEALIIAQAGRAGAVTIATNMAGRGVDIVLGGNPPDAEQSRKARDAGGLFVLGTERHEARRIDDQLRGRSGRQGDPGSTQFFVSLEDDLLRVFGPDRIKRMMGSFGIPEDQPLEHKLISRAIESAQQKIEGFHFDARKHVLDYDDVMNRQRRTVYQRRRELLFADAETIFKRAKTLVTEEMNLMIDVHASGDVSEWETAEIVSILRARFPVEEPFETALEQLTKGRWDTETKQKKLRQYLHEVLERAFMRREEEVGAEEFARVLKMLFLQTIDMVWVDHLEMMEYLRSSVRLRAYGQRDPLVEYKNEGIRAFRELDARIRSHFSHLALRAGAQPAAQRQPVREIRQIANVREDTQKNALSSERPFAARQPGRNDPCPCGSGKKYKRCHGA